MAFDVKQAIIDRLRATKRKNIDKVIDYMEKNRFFKYHCHHHHKNSGGLAEHAWQTYQIVLRLNANYVATIPDAQVLDENSIAIASLLHDFCKCSGMRHIRGHGIRSAEMLKELGLELTSQEYLAIRFHMSLKGKEDFSLYDDAKNSPLRALVHKADGKSAAACKGYEDPEDADKDFQPYLQNITQLACKSVVFQVNDGWFMNLHSPYDGELDPQWKDKIIGVKKYDTAKLYGINDSFIGAIYVLAAGNKKGLFVEHQFSGMQGSAYFSPDKEPFIYSEVKVYCDWDKWDDYGYAACKEGDSWKLVKVTQFPTPDYSVIGEGFSSAEEAMKSIGVEDCDRYLCVR